MKKLIVISFLFVSLFSMTYAKSPKAKVWVNSKAECCGVVNPIENLKWLDFSNYNLSDLPQDIDR